MQLGPPSRKGSLIFHIALAVLGAAGLVSFLLLYDRVSPMASVDFKVSREEASQIGERYLEGRGYDLEGYQRTIVFDTDTRPSYFLERTLGMAKANELMRGAVPLRFWYARWFRPLEKEEYRVLVEPNGKVLAFRHLLDEDAPGANLTQEEARTIAADFLVSEEAMRLDEYELQAPSSEKKTNRTDHAFTWQKKGFDAAGAKLRLQVSVFGEEIGEYNRAYLKVPEDFNRSFSKERSRARALTNASFGFDLILVICSALVIVWAYKYRALRVKATLVVGALIVCLGFANSLNYLPIIKSSYPTSQAMGTYLFNRCFRYLQTGLYFLYALVVGGIAGLAVAMEVWGRRRVVLAKHQDGWMSLAASSGRGILLGFFGLGYVLVFYFTAKSLGAWTPLRTPYTNLLGTKVPFLSPLLEGVAPAVAEETLFRLFAISLLLMVTKCKAIALLLPAIAWGFGHSSYVTSPVHLRGIELSIVGLYYGYIFLKFDLFTLIVAHYSYNAVVSGLPLIRSDNPYFFLTGVAVVSLPALLIIPGAYRALLGARRKPGKAPLEIAECTSADLEAHVDFWHALAGHRSKAPTEIPAVLESLRLELRSATQSQQAVVLVAKMDETIVGYIQGRIEDRQDAAGAGKTGLVLDIFVLEGHRRQGVGSTLFEHLSAWMRCHGPQSIVLEIDMKDTKAKPFWLTQGFTPSAEILRKEAGK